MMLYILLAIVILIVAVTLLRVRIRFVLTPEKRLLFVGLGRSGHEQDFVAQVGHLKLFGINVKTIRPEDKKADKPREKKPEKPPKKQKPKKPGRRRPIGDFIAVIPGVLRATGNYIWSLIKSVTVEELEGEIEGGFETPDLTGQAFGYYQAALGVVPSVVGRVRFIPDWTGESFRGSARVALAIPLYKIILRTIVLIFKLPLRKLIKLAIGRKKGDEDVQ